MASRVVRPLQVLVSCLAGAAALVALSAGPAAAAPGDYGDPAPLSTSLVILLFVVVPLAALIVIAVFTLPRGRGVGATAYRPGRPWGYARQWFGTVPPESTEHPRVSVPGLGGASARW